MKRGTNIKACGEIARVGRQSCGTWRGKIEGQRSVWRSEEDAEIPTRFVTGSTFNFPPTAGINSSSD